MPESKSTCLRGDYSTLESMAGLEEEEESRWVFEAGGLSVWQGISPAPVHLLNIRLIRCGWLYQG